MAFVRKDFLDRQRSGRLTVLGILFFKERITKRMIAVLVLGILVVLLFSVG